MPISLDGTHPLEMSEEERRVARAAKFGLPIACKVLKPRVE